MNEKAKRVNPVRKMGMGLLQEWPLIVNLATTLVFLVYGQGLLSNLRHPVWFTLILGWLLLIILSSIFAVVRHAESLAEKLGVPVVVDFSGCPGDSPTAKYPNWVTCPWPPDYLEVLAWQWDKVVTPYWIKQAKFAEDHGVQVAIEMHPGFVVYSPETMLKLRAIAGKSIGCNYDPSHMFWQGIDPIAAIRVLGDCIFHVHAKDTQIYDRNLPLTGVLDTKNYTDERNRAWIFRTCGYGHGAEWWKEFISTLRMFGYDYVLSIEHEDSLMSPEEGLSKAATFLNGIVIREQPAAAWWV